MSLTFPSLWAVGAALALLACGQAAGGAAGAVPSSIQAAVHPLPAALESELALSALPEHLRADATVYRLDPKKGFFVTKAGTNGFHAFVARNDLDGLKTLPNPGDYRDDFLIPIAFDAEGAKTIMPTWFDAAALQARGTPQHEMRKIILDRLSSGYYRAPTKAGLSYMLAPIMRVYPQPGSDMVSTMAMPHYMFYAPGTTNEAIGGIPASPNPFIANSGPHGYIIKTVGELETKEIVAGNRALIEKLCDHRKEFCLSDDAHAHGHG